MKIRSNPKKRMLYVILIVGVIVIGGLIVSLAKQKEVKEKPTLKIGYLPITHALLPIVVHAQGTLTKSSLEMVQYSDWAEMEKDIKTGKIDGGGSILNTLAIKIRSEGTPLHNVLLSVRDGSVIIVRNEINDISELKGKKVAIPSVHSPHYLLIHKYLVDHGLQPNIDVEHPVINPPDMVAALIAGDIEGYVVADPFGAQAEELGVGKVLVLSKNIGIPGSTSNECTISIREDFIKKHPEAVQEFVEQLILAGIWVEEHPKEASNLAVSYLNQRVEVILRGLTLPKGRTSYLNLYPNEDEFEAYQEYMVIVGILEEENKIDIGEFVDESFAEKAYKKFGLEKKLLAGKRL